MLPGTARPRFVFSRGRGRTSLFEVRVQRELPVVPERDRLVVRSHEDENVPAALAALLREEVYLIVAPGPLNLNRGANLEGMLQHVLSVPGLVLVRLSVGAVIARWAAAGWAMSAVVAGRRKKNHRSRRDVRRGRAGTPRRDLSPVRVVCITERNIARDACGVASGRVRASHLIVLNSMVFVDRDAAAAAMTRVRVDDRRARRARARVRARPLFEVKCV